MEGGVVHADVVLAPQSAAWRIPLAGRGPRVCLLVAIIALLSLVDLDLTLVYARTIGMSEGNPVARLVMGTNSVSAIVAFKLLTVLVAAWIILRHRGTRYAEVGAWVMTLVMAALMAQWCVYVQGMPELTPLLAQLDHIPDPRWIVLAN